TYGRDLSAAIHLLDSESSASGLSLRISSPVGEISVTSNLLGEMNALNIMAAVGVCLSMGIEKDDICAGIAGLASVPGRMEAVDNPFQRTIIVDFAHTPEALRTALASARKFTGGRLICVFGCGGDRDRTKRPVMGVIASSQADVVIVTSDNPRTEDPNAIIREIISGIDDPASLTVEPDRAEAIRKAIMIMNDRDCLIIAGKGHETYQIIGGRRIPFDDRDHVRNALKEVFGR
ncbi:MAG: UDP-N-acetylmuramyl-tripeptide synthetase, partial [Desulfomonilia bacterium]|nr:UDP-N-acetylmuramyl-tripeptide synthetase [Desulfomonilia bacterium]